MLIFLILYKITNSKIKYSLFKKDFILLLKKDKIIVVQNVTSEKEFYEKKKNSSTIFNFSLIKNKSVLKLGQHYLYREK